MRLRILSWNLMHGRSQPAAGRYLLDEFAAAVAGWQWDVALLQEVPPWWPPELAARAGKGTDARTVLTSRNFALALRRAVAVRKPDLIKSNGGGANAILVRSWAIEQHRTRRLCLWPERRWLQAVRLQTSAGSGGRGGDGVWVGNLHTGHTDAAKHRDAELARRTILEWAGEAPVVLGGDFNLRQLELEGFTLAGGRGVDLVYARGLVPVGDTSVLERGKLSDHVPVLVEVQS